MAKPVALLELKSAIEIALNKHEVDRRVRESEARFRDIIRSTGAGYFRIDTEGRFVDVNDAWLRMHGYSSREEVIGKDLSLVQIESDLEKAQRGVAESLGGRSIASGEFSRRCRDGEIGYHTFSANPVISGGKIVGLEGFLIDVTKQKRAEEELLRKKEELQTILDSVPALIFYKDVNNRVVNANKAWLQSFNFAPQDAIGKSLEEFLGPERAAEFHRDDMEVVDSGRAKKGIVEEIEMNGEPRWFMTHKVPFRDRKGDVVGVIGFSHDITDRKNVEDALQEKTRLLNSFLEALPDVVHFKDTEGRHLHVNSAFEQCFGLDRRSVIGKTVPELLPSDLAEQCTASDQR